MEERIYEVINFYERKRNHQEKMVEQKTRIYERQQERYDKGEISYEKLERAIKDKCIYDDFLRHTNDVLAELDYILNGGK